jgi:hypothetical protein
MSTPFTGLLPRDARSTDGPLQASRRTRPRAEDRVRARQRLYEITIPRMSIEADFAAVRHRLLADFPGVVEVLAMSTPSTVLIVYDGEDEVDSWCEALSDAVATRRRSGERHDSRISAGRIGARPTRPRRRSCSPF